MATAVAPPRSRRASEIRERGQKQFKTLGKALTFKRGQLKAEQNAFLQSQLGEWLGGLAGSAATPDAFCAALEDGVLLCDVVKSVKGSGIHEGVCIHDPAENKMQQLENLATFATACKNLKLHTVLRSSHLEHREMDSVLACLLDLARCAAAHEEHTLPAKLAQHLRVQEDGAHVAVAAESRPEGFMFRAVMWLLGLVPWVLLWRALDLLALFTGAALRFGSGSWVAKGLDTCERPLKPLVLYEFEQCPFCRRVREALSVLDIDVLVYPCPKTQIKLGVVDESRFRGEAQALSGKVQFPFLQDPNTGRAMLESSAIVGYLWETYGAGATRPLTYRLGASFVGTPGLFIASGVRPLPQHGMFRLRSRRPATPLELWGFEGSPVRETLCSLEIPYLLRQCAHGAVAHRRAFVEQHGHRLGRARTLVGAIQVPLLEDPNTGAVLLESKDIVAYLRKTYGEGAPVSKKAS